jgi:hypothetical protein
MKSFITVNVAIIKGIIQIKYEKRLKFTHQPNRAPIQRRHLIVSGLVLRLPWLTFWLGFNNLLSHFEMEQIWWEIVLISFVFQAQSREGIFIHLPYTWQNKLLKQERMYHRFYHTHYCSFSTKFLCCSRFQKGKKWGLSNHVI